MAQEKVTGDRGETIGWTETVSGRIKATDTRGNVLGYYYISEGKTVLPNGQTYSRGNDLRELIRASR